MRKILALAAITGLVLTLSTAADARGGFGGFGGGQGVGGFGGGSFNTPGQMLKQRGPYAATSGRMYPGASGYAPGRRMRMNGGPGYMNAKSGQFYPGATEWTPGNNLGYPTAK